MRCADDQCCGAHAASSEPAGRTVPRPYTARDRSTATAAETVEQTAVQGHEQTQQGPVPQLRNDGQGWLPHPRWRDAALAPHLICSRSISGSGGGDEAGHDGDAK